MTWTVTQAEMMRRTRVKRKRMESQLVVVQYHQVWVYTRTCTVHSTVQYSTVQYSTVQYSAVQYTVQYSTVQY